jgi:hypothetical protein
MKKTIVFALLALMAGITAFATTMTFPTGVSKYVNESGTAYYPDANGQISVIGDTTPYLRAGFKPTNLAVGVATGTSFNNVAITAASPSPATITIASNKTFTASNTLTLTGTDGSTLNIGTGGTLGTDAFASRVIKFCGTTSTCAASDVSITIKGNYGSVALSGSTATVAALGPYTSASSFVCTGVDASSPIAVKIANASPTAITITGYSSDTVNYICTGI